MSADEPLVLRGLRLFHGDLSPHLAALKDTFEQAWTAFGEAASASALLRDAFWNEEDPEVLRVLLPGLESLATRVREAARAQEDAVQIAALLRSTQLLPPSEEPLPVLRTAAAILDGNRDVDALQRRLSDADRARIARRRS